MTCAYCRGSLWVVAFTRPAKIAGEAYEEVGPCPMCAEGRGLETLNWPEEGFWQGRVPSDLPRFDTRLAPPDVARDYLAKLSRAQIGEPV